MNFNLLGIEDSLIKDLKELEKVINVSFTCTGEKVHISKLNCDSDICLEVKKHSIKYKNKNHLFRAIGLYLQLNSKDYFYKVEKDIIPYMGTMIDVSRNSVYKVDKIKQIILNLAMLGQNRLMLYTEDTYEVNGYEYFGYLRGKYSKEELKEIDDYGYKLGIEVIPCIQTLAHLTQTLKWDYANDIKDTDDILLVGEEKTYNFIEAMISSVNECFRSNNIHIGMDEAFNLGRGAYLSKNGYINHYEIMINHLNKVCKICEDYNLKPMMWDDMFFRVGSPDGFYYDQNTIISEDTANSITKNLSLVYWDYYHKDKDTYKKFFDIRKSFNNNVVFAGGIWKWSGIAPAYDQTIESTNKALSVCKEENIKEVIMTVWGDDGDETPIDTIIPGLILASEHAYSNEVDIDWINERCEFFTDLSLDDFLSIENIDKIEDGDSKNFRTVNPSKYLLYQDILLGAFDEHIKHLDNLENHYKSLASLYKDISTKSTKFSFMFDIYYKLSDLLSIKSTLGLKIKNAYDTNDKDTLLDICKITLPKLIDKVDLLQDSFRVLWYKECKGQGFEVIDLRLGTIKSRAVSSIYRLNSYINNEIDKIEELEEKRLYFNEQFTCDSKQICCNKYKDIATQNVISKLV